MLELPADAVVFDNDGVLVDSQVSVDRAWSAWARARGIDPALVLATAHGRPSRDTVAEFIDEAQRLAALAEVDDLELLDAGSIVPIAGARELVAQLPADRWAVVTSGTLPLASARLRAAGLPVPRVLVTADDVRHGKPDPEGYSLAVQRLGVDPGRTIVLEDSLTGIAAARAAGVGTIVGVGAGTLAAGVAAVVRDLRELSWHDGLRIDPAGRLDTAPTPAA
jgi:sugar-phosphatase